MLLGSLIYSNVKHVNDVNQCVCVNSVFLVE